MQEYLIVVDALTINEENRLKRKVEKLTKETDQIKELQKQITALNKKLGIEDPSDLARDIQLYEWMNRDPTTNRVFLVKGDQEMPFGYANDDDA